MTHSISGRGGVIAFLFVVGIVGFRILSLSSVQDPELNAKLLTELQSDAGNEVSKLLAEQKAAPTKDLSQLASGVGQLVNEKPTIHSVSVSTPLLSYSSSAKSVIKVDFSLPGRSKRTIRYYRAKDSLVGGWIIGQETTIIAFYLNFF